MEGCRWFGDIQSTSGESGTVTSIGSSFYDDDGSQRPSLGDGTFKGDLVTTYKGLVRINELGNYSQTLLGGGSRTLEDVGYSIPQLLSIGGTRTGRAGIMQMLGTASTDSGACWNFNPTTGGMDWLLNCYWYDNGTNLKAFKIGDGYRICFAPDSSDVIQIYHYSFADTTTSITAASFSKIYNFNDNGDVEFGTDGVQQGSLTVWDGAGGNTPAYILLYSPNGTAHYFFVEDDGTLKQHTAAPTQNSDGNAVGSQIN